MGWVAYKVMCFYNELSQSDGQLKHLEIFEFPDGLQFSPEYLFELIP